MLWAWRDALVLKGLPLESHNQSFIAFLHHYLSGEPTHILSEGGVPRLLGWSTLSIHQIVLLSLFWTATTMSFTLGWIFSGSKHEPLQWIVVTIALLIIPSHLIWKPYFVMSMPIAIYFFHQCNHRSGWVSFLIITSIFIGINFTGFDFIGHHWGPYFEAASSLLLMHLILLLSVIFRRRMAED